MYNLEFGKNLRRDKYTVALTVGYITTISYSICADYKWNLKKFKIVWSIISPSDKIIARDTYGGIYKYWHFIKCHVILKNL